MNVNTTLMQAATVFGVPVYPNAYNGARDGQPDDYIVFGYADERPDVYADDTDEYDATIIQLHEFFRSGDAPGKKKALRRFLRQRGFIILSTSEFFEDGTGYTHVVVEARIFGYIDEED